VQALRSSSPSIAKHHPIQRNGMARGGQSEVNEPTWGVNETSMPPRPGGGGAWKGTCAVCALARLSTTPDTGAFLRTRLQVRPMHGPLSPPALTPLGSPSGLPVDAPGQRIRPM
jgi:hypothetical protein